MRSRREEHDAFAADDACLHVLVRLDDVVEPVDGSNRNDGTALGDGVEELLQYQGGRSLAPPEYAVSRTPLGSQSMG